MRAPKFDPQPIRDAQAAQGLSDEQLAVRAGLSYAGVHHIRSGRNEPKAETLARICRALGISVDDCFSPRALA